jgi:hypothetical protein
MHLHVKLVIYENYAHNDLTEQQSGTRSYAQAEHD